MYNRSEDIDKVLRIRGLDINPDEITSFVTNLGYYCEELPDDTDISSILWE